MTRRELRAAILSYLCVALLAAAAIWGRDLQSWLQSMG